MRKMKTSLIVLTMAASLMFATIGMAEARSQNTNNNYHQYSRSYYSHRNHQAKLYKNNYNHYNRYNKAQHGKHQRSLKQARRYSRNNGNLYSGFVGAGLLLLGVIRCGRFAGA